MDRPEIWWVSKYFRNIFNFFSKFFLSFQNISTKTATFFPFLYVEGKIPYHRIFLTIYDTVYRTVPSSCRYGTVNTVRCHHPELYTPRNEMHFIYVLLRPHRPHFPSALKHSFVLQSEKMLIFQMISKKINIKAIFLKNTHTIITESQ